jgi:hypothetical protein
MFTPSMTVKKFRSDPIEMIEPTRGDFNSHGLTYDVKFTRPSDQMRIFLPPYPHFRNEISSLWK